MNAQDHRQPIEGDRGLQYVSIDDEPLVVADAEFRESEHPRDEDGKFVAGGGGSPSKKNPSDHEVVRRLLAGGKLTSGRQGEVGLVDIAKTNGFDRPAKMVSRGELDRVAEESPYGKLYRGAGDREFGAETVAHGDYHAGHGAYGRGLYFGQNEKAVEKVSQFAGTGGAMVEAALVPDAKVADYNDVEKEFKQWSNELSESSKLSVLGKEVESGEITEDQAQKFVEGVGKLRYAVPDATTFAALLGYDAVHVRSSTGEVRYRSLATDVGADELVVLNRSALVVSEDDPHRADAASAPPPLRAAGVLFVAKDGRVLLTRRTAEGDHEGEWAIPGGKLEGDETPAQAAAREAEEETGRAVDPDELREWTRRVRDGVDYTTFTCSVDDEFEPRLNEEHDAHLWIDRKVAMGEMATRADASEWEESKHPRGQPENAGQFASSPGGGSKASLQSVKTSSSKSPITKGSPASQAKRLEKARAEVRSIVEPSAVYEDLFKSATEAFKQNGISLDKEYGRSGEPDKLSLRKWGGDEKIDPDSLGKVLGPIWKDLEAANNAAAQRWSPSFNARSHENIKKIADIVSGYAGYDTSKLTVTDDDYKFSLNDRECFAGGTAHLNTGEIKLYARQLSPESVAPVMAHEVMHQKWERVYNAWKGERDEALMLAKAVAYYKGGQYQALLRRYEGEGKPLDAKEGAEFSYMHALVEEGRMPKEDPLTAEDKPRGAYAERWPIYAVLGSLDTRLLAEDDGITDYSREWWAEAEKKGGDWTRSAIHETLAEMARLEWEGSLDRLLWYKESKSWKSLYQAVQKFYPEVSRKR